ncbi:unnamed protein product, partial [Symbiodinium necroappetens]
SEISTISSTRRSSVYRWVAVATLPVTPKPGKDGTKSKARRRPPMQLNSRPLPSARVPLPSWRLSPRRLPSRLVLRRKSLRLLENGRLFARRRGCIFNGLYSGATCLFEAV